MSCIPDEKYKANFNHEKIVNGELIFVYVINKHGGCAWFTGSAKKQKKIRRNFQNKSFRKKFFQHRCFFSGRKHNRK